MQPEEWANLVREWRIIDRRALIGRGRRVSTRAVSNIDALVLHQTGFTRGSSHSAYDRIGVHYVVTPDGSILQLYGEDAYLHASNGFNRRSVAVEFVGNFPNQTGNWWRGGDAQNIPSEQQIGSGRFLVDFLQRWLGITHVFAHRQATSPNRRGNCPGPHIWFNVGEWAKGRGLSDGGAGFAIGNGGAIPQEWRDPGFGLMSA